MNTASKISEKDLEASDAALRIVFVGHVDHGKSTLVGRILYETKSILPSKIKYVEDICKDKGMQFEYAFLLDALEEEQDQGVTIDVSQVNFKTSKRPYRVIDSPGHKEFLKNMVSGASTADAAILLIDAEEGLREQSRRHATILSLLGIRTIIVVINKMDLVDYRQEVYDRIREEYSRYLSTLKLKAAAFIPLSAYHGDNLVAKSDKMPWYGGEAFLPFLDSLEHRPPQGDLPLRFPLQDVYKFDKKRIFAGRIEAGRIREGEEVVFLPSEKTGVVKSIEKWSAPKQKSAAAGESVGIVLEDQIFAERGEVICHPKSRPVVGKSFVANIFWMGNHHLKRKAKCLLKLTTQEVECVIDSVLKVINSSTLEQISDKSHEIAKNEVAEILIHTKKPVAMDSFDQIAETGRFVIEVDNKVCGGGIILKAVENVGHAI